MIGIDTHVLVRYIMQDDAKQSARAARLIEGLTVDDPGFVPLVTIVELAWVLSCSFDLGRQQICDVFDVLLRSKSIVVDRAELVLRALRAYREGSADFADCLIERSAFAAGCSHTMTFDAKAAKTAGMSLVP